MIVNKIRSDNAIYSNIYVNMRKKISSAYLLVWLFVSVVEFGVGVLLWHWKLTDFGWDYISRFILFPMGVDLIIIMVTQLVIATDKIASRVKNYILVTTMAMIAVVLSSVHSYFLVSYSFFIAPVIITTVFLDKKLSYYSFGVSVAGLCISTFWGLWFCGTYPLSKRLESAVIMLVVLVVVLVIVLLVDDVHVDRELLLTRVKMDNARLADEIKTDGLTGLYNHTSFYSALESTLADARGSGQIFTVVILDVDYFKQINDTFGHGMGDRVLQMISDVLKSEVARKGMVFRYGGDEFAVIFRNSLVENAAEMMDYIRSKILLLKDQLPDETGFGVSISVGLTQASGSSTSAEAIFEEADAALLQAKADGKNCCRINRNGSFSV